MAARNRRLAELRAEPEHIRAGEVEFLAHALVVPSQDPEEVKRYDAQVEAIAMKVAAAYEGELRRRIDPKQPFATINSYRPGADFSE